MMKVHDVVKVCKYIQKNRRLLLDVWEHGEDSTNERAWRYYQYLQKLK